MPPTDGENKAADVRVIGPITGARLVNSPKESSPLASMSPACPPEKVVPKLVPGIPTFIRPASGTSSCSGSTPNRLAWTIHAFSASAGSAAALIADAGVEARVNSRTPMGRNGPGPRLAAASGASRHRPAADTALPAAVGAPRPSMAKGFINVSGSVNTSVVRPPKKLTQLSSLPISPYCRKRSRPETRSSPESVRADAPLDNPPERNPRTMEPGVSKICAACDRPEVPTLAR